MGIRCVSLMQLTSRHTARCRYFFLVVKNDVGYQVVAAFLIEGETRENTAPALTKIEEWNPDFNSLYAMVDYCAKEIYALETLSRGK